MRLPAHFTGSSPDIRPQRRPSRPLGNQALFSGKLPRSPLQKVQPEEIKLDIAASISPEEQTPDAIARHLKRLRQVHQHGLKGKQSPNFSNRHYAAGLLARSADNQTPQWTMGTNIEPTWQHSTCDLRVAYDQLRNQAIQKGQEKAPLIDTIYLVNADLNQMPPIPCADCQNLMTTQDFSPKTRVISLQQDPDTRQFRLKMRTIQDMLPYSHRDIAVRYTTDAPLDTLPVTRSPQAKQVLSNTGKPPQESLRSLLQQAQESYLNGVNPPNRTQTGSAMLLSPIRTPVTGSRLNWSTRWFQPADLAALHHGLEIWQRVQTIVKTLFQTCQAHLPDFIRQPLESMFQRAIGWLKQHPHIQAVAYYGDEPHLPPISSLGRLARKHATPDTLIVTIENDRVQIRTLADYMPEMYHSNS